MAWDFSTDLEFQEKLDWVGQFVRDEVEPLDLVYPHLHYTPPTDEIRHVIDPLKSRVRAQGLWAAHLGPDLGGKGFGQVKLALLNEILGRSDWAPIIFGTQAPDTGNAEILAHYGTESQKARFLQPLLDGEIFSCYSMTEPQGGADPGEFTCRGYRDGDEWIIDGWKFFSSNASTASFLIVMVVTDPEASPHNGMSMFLVPSDTPGVEIVRDIKLGGDPANAPGHALIHYDQVRLPGDSLLGEEGQGFAVAQTRLGGGRVHHSMRTVGLCQRALDMMCERALSRTTKGSLLAEKQMVQQYIADSWAQIQQLRLLVLHTAWIIDQKTTAGSRKEIAAIKTVAADVLHDVVMRAIQVHGALGISEELPLWRWLQQVFVVRFSDGPSEVHRITLARQVLKGYERAPGLWPSEHIPSRTEPARAHVALALEEHLTG
ncbi:MAG: acyl-CoA dehydrogenase [Acidimicrobiaceae bacterium]|nr:acyl-CoA dehydrogenase [Acidimicrobiaceae bacterium]